MIIYIPTRNPDQLHGRRGKVMAENITTMATVAEHSSAEAFLVVMAVVDITEDILMEAVGVVEEVMEEVVEVVDEAGTRHRVRADRSGFLACTCP